MKIIIALIAGAVTTAATMYGVFLLESQTNFNLFGWYLGGILPVGAIFVGAVATSGAILAARFLHLRANIAMYLVVLILAVGANVLFYYLAYQRDLGVAGLTANDMSFMAYVDSYASNFVYAGFELGSYGKWFLLIDVIGFIIGGSLAFVFIATAEACETCGQYLRKVETSAGYFNDADELAFYYNLAADKSPSVKQRTACVNSGSAEYVEDTHTLRWDKALLTCKSCETYFWRDTVTKIDQDDWKGLPNLDRLMPLGTLKGIAELFKGRSTAADRDRFSTAYFKANHRDDEAEQISEA